MAVFKHLLYTYLLLKVYPQNSEMKDFQFSSSVTHNKRTGA
jgi:hypothetical protein